jgi:small subunit ribosomal protein S20
MPILKNAKKALRSSQRKAVTNALTRQHLRTSLRQATAKPGQAASNLAFSSIDRAVKRGLVHRNTAARLKRKVSKLGVSASAK